MTTENAETLDAGARTQERTSAGADNDPAHGGEGIAQTARAQASAVWSDTKDQARSALAGQQKAAAAGIGDFAGALRSAAGELESRDKSTAAHLAQRAADELERLSGTLRSKDFNTMVRDAESFARRQPAVFIGAAVAVGFLATRFLKSSSEHPAESQTARSTPPEGSASSDAYLYESSEPPLQTQRST